MPKVSKYVKDGLTPKQRKFARGIAAGKGKAEAYRAAGYTTKYPSQDASKTLQKPEVLTVVKKEEERLQRVLESEINNERIAKKYSELIEAQDAYGNSDNGSQLKALDQIHKLRGDYAPEKSIKANVGESFLEKLAKQESSD